ncbi:hypothetical protein [Streptomyces cupreus]|uniref:Uncharacterized protein n=1 Tax=Streptomyces cupreus TaxID=2759956 RepID=A0A7X1J2L8_9ACTN|nr:hypothetical protein [Streptomyces cupreus]MBC2903086.1 hypothetical protein [Streptomyces cupreus]
MRSPSPGGGYLREEEEEADGGYEGDNEGEAQVEDGEEGYESEPEDSCAGTGDRR